MSVTDDVIEHQMPRSMFFSLGNLSQQASQKSFQPGQIGFDVTDDHGFHIGALDGFFGGRIKLRMIHAEQGLGSGILELVVELGGGVERVAGDTNRARFEDSEINGRVVGQIGKKNGDPVSLANAFGMQEIGNPVCRVLDLGKGAGRIVENRIRLVGIILDGFVYKIEQGDIIVGNLVGNTFGPVGGGPGR